MNRIATAGLGCVFGACLAFLALCGTTYGDQSSIYQVGLAKRDITPEYPIRLNGFGNRRQESSGVSQRIYARALSISQGDAPPLILLAVDSLGIRIDMVNEVASRLRASHGIPRENIALTFTHSHCTPKVNGAADNIFSNPIPAAHQEHIDRYTRELTDHLAEVADLAVTNRRASRLEWATGTVRFSKNRRTPGGPVDQDLPTLFVRDAESAEIRAVYVAYACHCVTLSFNQISGDWAGYAVESIERDIPGALALVSIGAGSDANPIPGVQGDKVEVAASQGEEIAVEVQRLLKLPRRPVSGAVAATLNRIDLPLNPLPTREELEALVKQGRQIGYNATTQLLRLDRGESLQAAIDYPIQTWSFGDRLCMVFLAGEVCVDYSIRLKGELDRDRFWLNAYSNDFCSYIPSERLAREGRYGGGSETPYFALPTTIAAGMEQRIVDEVQRQVPDVFNAAKGTQGVPPKSPEASMDCLTTHDTLRVELVAAEPLIQDPVAIDFGTDGRLWVAEMSDYGRGVYERFQQRGRIRWLRDTDHDGRCDQAQTFVSGLRFPTDVKVWRDGVLICDAPDILFARDETGDGVADSTVKLFSGFDVRNAQARVNSLRWGLDNWLYGSGGLFGGRLVSHQTGKTVDVGSRDFRLDPDSGAIEPASGRTQQGRCRNDWGDWFGCSNGTLIKHYPTAASYARRNPHVVPAPAEAPVADEAALTLFPPPGLVRFALSGAPGKATAACGLGIYRDSLLGSQYQGNAFTCEPVHQLVHRMVLEPQGLRFRGRRARNELHSEFLSSSDPWFRPVQMRTGPDGAIWVVDMYRYVIEHSRWIPQSTLARLNVYAGQGRGRIYRVLPRETGSADGPPNVPLIPNLEELSDAALVQQLDHHNGTVRDLAQQLLVWRNAKSVTKDLATMSQAAERPLARIHALATLEAIGQLTTDELLSALQSDHPEVVRHAIRLSEPLLNDAAVTAAVIRHVAHPSIRVRRQVAWSLGEADSTAAAQALSQLLIAGDGDADLRSAALSSVSAKNAVTVWQACQEQIDSTGSRPWVQSLVTIAMRVVDANSQAAILKSIVLPGPDAHPEPETLDAGITTFVAALDAADARPMDDTTAGDTTAGDTTAGDIPLDVELCHRVRAIHVTAARIVNTPPTSGPQLLRALAVLGRRRGPLTSRLLACDTAKAAAPIAEEQVAGSLAALISARHSDALQQAAVTALARTGQSRVAELLLARFSSTSGPTRQLMLDTLLSRAEWTRSLVREMASGQLPASRLDASRRQRLLSHEREDIRVQATALFQRAGSPSRGEVLTRYESALSMSGDVQRGRVVFRKTCAPCHRVEDHGSVVGPDLLGLTNHDSRWLLGSILDPNREVDSRYLAWTAVGQDGRTVTGLLVEETATAIRLREASGKEQTLLRQDLELFRSSELSFMPEGLEKDLSPQPMADLLAYVTSFQVAPKQLTGNHPRLIVPDANGVLGLTAKHAEIRGEEITFETPHENIGYWHAETDCVSWRVHVPVAGAFDVYVEAACDKASAGNSFRIEGLPARLVATVKATGGWGRFRQERIGAVELEVGDLVITVRADGPLTRPALFDLREVRLVPAGQATQFATTAVGDLPLPRYPPEIAPFLLDASQSPERRRLVIDQRPGMGPAIVARLVAGLPPDDPSEAGRRIPWIWRVALAVGKRNDGGEIRDLLEISLPRTEQPLQQWQAVVVGGGIINGLTQIGAWPDVRVTEILAGTPTLAERWPQALARAATMADDGDVRGGTRYDALRMIALAGWEAGGPQLVRYLADGRQNQLQMGAVSGLGDIRDQRIIEPLMAALASESLTVRNRQLAIETLRRTETRALALLDAVKTSRITCTDEELNPFVEHASAAVREAAGLLK